MIEWGGKASLGRPGSLGRPKANVAVTHICLDILGQIYTYCTLQVKSNGKKATHILCSVHVLNFVEIIDS